MVDRIVGDDYTFQVAGYTYGFRDVVYYDGGVRHTTEAHVGPLGGGDVPMPAGVCWLLVVAGTLIFLVACYLAWRWRRQPAWNDADGEGWSTR